MKLNLKITRNYSFWKHPVMWFKDRKKIKLLDFLVKYQLEHGMREEIRKIIHDLEVYGSVITKDGKRIDPKNYPTTN